MKHDIQVKFFVWPNGTQDWQAAIPAKAIKLNSKIQFEIQQSPFGSRVRNHTGIHFWMEAQSVDLMEIPHGDGVRLELLSIEPKKDKELFNIIYAAAADSGGQSLDYRRTIQRSGNG